jgi:hypothetical protein
MCRGILRKADERYETVDKEAAFAWTYEMKSALMKSISILRIQLTRTLQAGATPQFAVYVVD